MCCFLRGSGIITYPAAYIINNAHMHVPWLCTHHSAWAFVPLPHTILFFVQSLIQVIGVAVSAAETAWLNETCPCCREMESSRSQLFLSPFLLQQLSFSHLLHFSLPMSGSGSDSRCGRCQRLRALSGRKRTGREHVICKSHLNDLAEEF